MPVPMSRPGPGMVHLDSQVPPDAPVLKAAEDHLASMHSHMPYELMSAAEKRQAQTEAAQQTLREGAETPPTPATPSVVATPRNQPDALNDNEGRQTPPTPCSAGQVQTPPPEGGTDHRFEEGNQRGARKRGSWTYAGGQDDLQELGDLSNLTSEQREARAALRDRLILRTSHAETMLPPDLNLPIMADLLEAFDAMVLKCLRETKDVDEMLRSNRFWEEVDELEARVADEQDLTKLEMQVNAELDKLENEIKQQGPHIESILSNMIDGVTESTDEAMAQAETLEAGDRSLYNLLPNLRQSILVKRYAKYMIRAQGLAQMQREHALDPSKSMSFKEEGELAESGFASGARALWKRKMRVDHVNRQREAEKDGAFIPTQPRPADALNAQQLQFVGPVFGSKQPLAVANDSSFDDSRDSREMDEEFIPGQRWKAPPMPDLRPPPPEMPSRRDLAYAAWARPAVTRKQEDDCAKKRFFEMHLPRRLEGVPAPPSMPSSVRAPPMPGKDIPSHKLSINGLPMKCSVEHVLAWMGGHAENVNQGYNNPIESYQRGIAIYKGQDGWLTGKGTIKFVSKPACLAAMAALDRTRMGSRVIRVDFLMGKVFPPRGRLLLSNLARKTTVKDLQKWLQGWHLASEEDGQAPYLQYDHEGFHTGEAILTFEDVESSENCLAKFPWNQQLHGMTIIVRNMPPLRYDDVEEQWLESS